MLSIPQVTYFKWQEVKTIAKLASHNVKLQKKKIVFFGLQVFPSS